MPYNIIAFIVGIICGMLFEIMLYIIIGFMERK